MGRRAQAVVTREKGATLRHAQVIVDQLRAHERARFPVVAG